MIYTRCGAPVQLLCSEERELDLSKDDPRYLPSLGKPKVWFVKAKMTGPYPDGSGEAGEVLFDGDWFQAGADLRADNGWAEIEDACKEAEGVVWPNPLAAVFHK